MIGPEFWHRRMADAWRNDSPDHTYPRSFLDERAAHHEKCADLLAIDGVTLSLDEATAPCALTPGALFGEAP